ncbi:MAG: molybdopterin molybdotransferase MoeA, partial [Desulfocapsaceae bacterium]|nr:molybdopterin molybdotransferase MoeA [Desulfocapsaceae bacterium]
RVVARDVCAELPDPGYDQSLRDGFVIGSSALGGEDDRCFYQVIGEIPAGCCHSFEIGPGEAYRIMTGGMMPGGAERVVQQEDCIYISERIEVPAEVLKSRNRFIQERGSSISRAAPVVSRGTLLGAADVGMLATTGNRHLDVYRRVSVSFFCSGNELVSLDAAIKQGQKISSNCYLLAALLNSCQALPVDWGVARDTPAEIEQLLSEISSSNTDIIVSTGGMGPGKYDVLKTVFEKTGGEVIYRSIAMRPGQSTLFGILAGKLYFGLPGPPFAVGVLFHELVLPALRRMQGHRAYLNRDDGAVLDQDISAGKNRFLTVREGILFFRDCTRHVRLPGDGEQPDCYILLDPGRSRYVQGDVVRIHKTR